MCLFAAAFQTLPGCRLLVLANREEFYGRPSGPPRIVNCGAGAEWLGGIDLQGGGTWLGVNRRELLVAITNRPKNAVAAEARSRGLLCRDLLACETVEEARDELHRQRGRHAYDGFNLLVWGSQQGIAVEAGNEFVVHDLEPGLHVIANGPLNDSGDRRVQRARVELSLLAEETDVVEAWLDRGAELCRLHANGDEPAICRHGGDRGTVSSTLIALTDDPAEARYRHAHGPPCETEYADYAEQLRLLLASG